MQKSETNAESEYEKEEFEVERFFPDHSCRTREQIQSRKSKTTRQSWYKVLFFLYTDYEGWERENLQTILGQGSSFARLNDQTTIQILV